ncbi:hypothetical protein M0R88_03430 [Halorussus gelatinilyticus]|uniref:Uncharacterized protein n=1 Tax=Halorussus gelatinilyticus TaxID=2937524 RepID=A0A8U0IP51_9EURY|nr:hypothetical protein [Halorussus gelatinilyticus]UPW02371.1 hypothetical protein M0R88_03430 [Halorussus gelatinilyticus]
MRARADESSWKLWLLMEANRWVVASVLLVGVFVALVAIGVLDPSPLQRSVAQSDPTETLFQAFVTVIITGVTLVVTLNQLVLSQELGPVGDQRGRMEGAMEFRQDVEEVLDSPVSPPEPASFLQALIDETRSRANELADAVSDSRDEDLRDVVEDYVDALEENANEVSDQLDEAEFGSYDLLSAVLDFNYSWKIFVARRLHNEQGDALTDETEDAFDDLVEVLSFFGPAREHFKTLYFQWELVNLSRAMLYSAVPALVVAASMIIYYDAEALPGATLGISNDILVTSFATTVAIVPFMLLLSYILRIATVAKRTLSIGPFVLRGVDRSDELDFE